MAKKNKGAALYELLYKDKGKATTGGGVLKLPSWFQRKNEPQPSAQPLQAGPAAPAAPVPAAPGEASPASAGSVPSFGGGAKTESAAEEIIKSASAGDADSVAAGKSGTFAMPVKSAGAGAGRQPFLTSRPMIGGGLRWVEFNNGRIRLDVSHFAALITAGVAVCVVLLSFIVGVYKGKHSGAAAGLAVRPGVDKVDDARKLPAENVVPAPKPRVHPAGTVAGTGGGATAEIPFGGVLGKEDAMVTGKYYVKLATLGKVTDDAARHAGDEVVRYFASKPGVVEVVLRDSGGMYLVRTRRGYEKDQLDAVEAQIIGVMADLVKEKKGVISYDPAKGVRQLQEMKGQ